MSTNILKALEKILSAGLLQQKRSRDEWLSTKAKRRLQESEITRGLLDPYIEEDVSIHRNSEFPFFQPKMEELAVDHDYGWYVFLTEGW